MKNQTFAKGIKRLRIHMRVSQLSSFWNKRKYSSIRKCKKSVLSTPVCKQMTNMKMYVKTDLAHLGSGWKQILRTTSYFFFSKWTWSTMAPHIDYPQEKWQLQKIHFVYYSISRSDLATGKLPQVSYSKDC